MPLVLGLARHPEVFIAGLLQKARREGMLVFLQFPQRPGQASQGGVTYIPKYGGEGEEGRGGRSS